MKKTIKELENLKKTAEKTSRNLGCHSENRTMHCNVLEDIIKNLNVAIKIFKEKVGE
jgi:hypothetical protein